MSAKNVNGADGKPPTSAATNLIGKIHDTKQGSNRKKNGPLTDAIAGGAAGMMEALACHPLDTIKVRMQLSRRARAPGVSVSPSPQESPYC